MKDADQSCSAVCFMSLSFVFELLEEHWSIRCTFTKAGLYFDDKHIKRNQKEHGWGFSDFEELLLQESGGENEEQWQQRKQGRWFLEQCADHCGGQWRQLHSHSLLRPNVRNFAICHYTKPELYLARAILRKLWAFQLQRAQFELIVSKYLNGCKSVLRAPGKCWFKNIL